MERWLPGAGEPEKQSWLFNGERYSGVMKHSESGYWFYYACERTSCY